MEYVDGCPLTDYCDAQKLTITERLKLFQKVCEAVRYAHQNLIVHRDLKPGNIFVTQEGVVKLLDFGIAKLIHDPLHPPENTLTQTGLQPMSPYYASPEQVSGEMITTSSDVWSLGVTLYELLTGHRPFWNRQNSLPEITRLICEEDPEITSKIIFRPLTETQTQSVTSSPMMSQLRDATPEKLGKRLQGDLDNILLKALRKEPLARYQSVEQFGEDITRHLNSEPIIARPSTLKYRTTKYIRRHRMGVALAALTLIFSWAH